MLLRSAPLALVLVLAACGPSGTSNQPAEVVCTMEAKLCPDGSSVGRSGPNCEFAACPEGQPPAQACTKEAKLCPDGSSVGRSGPNCEFAPCPGEAAAPPAGEPKMCTMEAKLCPDGSSVGRSGPNCEFAPCPGDK